MDFVTEAMHLMEEQKIDEALKLIEDILKEATTEEKLLVVEFYMEWGFYEEASEQLKGLLATYPNESELNIMLAEIYIELEKDEAAINLLNEIKSSDPSYPQALLQLADLYQSQGLYEVAELKLHELKKQLPNEPTVDFAFAEFLFSIGEYSRAITFYERLVVQTDEIAQVSLAERLAESYAVTGNYEKALDYYKQIDTDQPEVLFKYGFTAAQMKRFNIAISVWEDVIEIDPYFHAVYSELAKVYKHEGLLEKAYETVKKGINYNEYNKELFLLAAQIAKQLNKANESEQYVRQAIALDADYKAAVLFLIRLLKESNDYSGIIELIKEIKTLSAHDYEYEWELARAYNEEEQYKLALQHYNEAYKGLVEDSDFLKEFGYFLTESGKIQQAITVFHKYLKLQPLDYETEMYVERLRFSNEEMD